MVRPSNLTVFRGDTYRNTLAITNKAGAVDDLTGATAWLTVKRHNDWSDNDSVALLRLFWVDGGDNDGITVDDPSTGVIAVEITPTQSDSLPVATYAYDVQVLSADGHVDTPVFGTLTVTRDTTRELTTP